MICVPLQVKTEKELVSLAREAKKRGAEAIEIWLDFLKEVNKNLIIELKRKIFLPIICTAKPKRENGKYKGDEASRIKLLKLAVQEGADYIDIGIDTPHALIRDLFASAKKTKIIISYHNFKKIPSLKTLKNIFQKMQKYNPAIYKFAITPRNPKDTILLIQFLKFLFDKKVAYTVIGMGIYGKFLRQISPVLGNKITYMALSASHRTAKGQLIL